MPDNPKDSRLTLQHAPDVLTVAEAAVLLRIGRNCAYTAVQCGQIPSIRLGRRVLIPKAALMALIGVSSANADDER